MKTASVNSPDPNLIIRCNSSEKIIAIWLFILCSMVFFMVILGGLTRLTHSGLSMVDWRPITGWLPPIGLQEWQSAFDLYKESPEFIKINDGMTIEGFKSIFWLEYSHRLWGRIMGVAFLLPFVFFIIKGRISRVVMPRLIIILLMGGFQGILGWYMVKSGLIDNPDVSQYRLAAHLSAAVIIYGYMFWVAMSLLQVQHDILRSSSPKFIIASVFVAFWIFLTIVSGGFVAGLDAGLTYNTFPLMDGQFVPDGLWSKEPWYINFFENITTVQFDHRILAEITLLLVVGAWWTAQKSNISKSVRKPFQLMLVMVLVQMALGISTLMLVVPVFVASLHQIGGLVLFTFSIWSVHNLMYKSK
jgi:cytochrome c oxidase assembly protein subunit 15